MEKLVIKQSFGHCRTNGLISEIAYVASYWHIWYISHLLDLVQEANSFVTNEHRPTVVIW